MKDFIKYSILIFLLFVVAFVKGQNNQVLKADAEFKIKNYANAVSLYQKILEADKGDIEKNLILK
ncbi:MAG: hypothetical protein HOG79_17210, partial [Prolixibacteraceae bacterium]|nr:hypothetical protein [Prolixibacteraceae bacterium]